MPSTRTLYSLSATLLLLCSLAGGALAEEERKIKIQIKNLHAACEDGDEDCHHIIIDSKDSGAHAIHLRHGAKAMVLAMGSHSGTGGHLGVALSDLTPELRAHFGVPDNVGVMVSKVLEESPAFDAGIEVGDIVTAIDGEEIGGAGELARLIRSREAGDVVVVEAWRKGQLLQINATLDETEGVLHAAHRMFQCEDGEDCNIDFDFDFGDLDFAKTIDLDFLHDLKLNFGHGLDLDFGCDGEDCKIVIQCEDDGECDCTVNGETADCPDLGKLHKLHN